MSAYMQLDSGTILEVSDPSIWPEAKRLSKAKGKAALREESRKDLLATLKPGDTILMVLRHVARSGMSRRIDFYKQVDGGEMIYLTQRFAWLLDERMGNPGLIVGGCGMDMGFHIVYNVASTLWRDGFGCVGERCPSNDHSNGDRDHTMHGCFDENGRPENRAPHPGEAADGCKQHWHRDGGYALRYRWL